jgi:hypothetical protein
VVHAALVAEVARLNPAQIRMDGTLDAWNPGANSDVLALAASGGTVFAGGFFTFIGGQARNDIAALDATSVLVTAWNPNAAGWPPCRRSDSRFAQRSLTSARRAAASCFFRSASTSG